METIQETCLTDLYYLTNSNLCHLKSLVPNTYQQFANTTLELNAYTAKCQTPEKAVVAMEVNSQAIHEQ